MSSIKSVDGKLIDLLFEQNGNRGYLLDFSNTTFARFFGDEFGIDIYADAYAGIGNSKMNRLRGFLQKADDATALKVLHELWDYRKTVDPQLLNPVPAGEELQHFAKLVRRLGGTMPEQTPTTTAAPVKAAAAAARAAQLKQEFMALNALAPQQRGFAFEKFLKALFDAHGLQARDAFRNRGEQIDGSFQHGGSTYLVEAKWQGPQIGAAELHIFEGKLGEKARWARGLFISHSGFSSVAFDGFGRAKATICMDGLDLFETLDRELDLAEVLEKKARRAAETGMVFARVRDLFPG